jgi:NADH:ubiquinone oxidoreductase subunit K
MLINQFLFLAAILFCIGVYGVLARKNGVMVLMSIELILNAVNINLVAFAAMWGTKAPATGADPTAATIGPVFALFVIAVAAAEVGVGLALILMLFRNRRSIDIDELDLMKG